MEDIEPSCFLIAAVAYGIEMTAAKPLVAAGPTQSEGGGDRRVTTEIAPVGVSCNMPRLRDHYDHMPLIGTARNIVVRANPVGYIGGYVGQATVTGCELVPLGEPEEWPGKLPSDWPTLPADWPRLLRSRGKLFTPASVGDAQDAYLLDHGHQGPYDLNLLRVAGDIAKQAGPKTAKLEFRSALRALIAGGQCRVAVLDRYGEGVEMVGSIDLSGIDGLAAAMSVVADLALARWLLLEAAEETTELIRSKATRAKASEVVERFLRFDDLFYSFLSSAHATESRELLDVFESDRQWTHLSRRLQLAVLARGGA